MACGHDKTGPCALALKHSVGGSGRSMMNIIELAILWEVVLCFQNLARLVNTLANTNALI